MKVFSNGVAAALALGAALAAPATAQNSPACDPTANTRGDIAKAQFSMTRAISASEKGNPSRDLQDVLRLVDAGTDNPTARNYLRGEAYIIYLMQPNAAAVVPRSALGLTTSGASRSPGSTRSTAPSMLSMLDSSIPPRCLPSAP